MKHSGILLALGLLALPAAASADIALLSTGATMKVSGQRVEGDTVVLALKGGGEVGVPAAMLKGIVPDEVLRRSPPRSPARSTSRGWRPRPPAATAWIPPS